VIEISYIEKPKPKAELFEIVCSTCGKSDFVNFKPDPKRRIFCRECFRAHKEMLNDNQKQFGWANKK
jgi:CxxC-x17-CxxC domain-containing protein